MRCRFQAPGARHPRLRAPRYRRRAQPIQSARRFSAPARQRARPPSARSPSQLPAGSPRPGVTGPAPATRRQPSRTSAGKTRVVAPPPSAAAPSRPAAAIAPKPQLQPEIRRAPPPPPAVQVARPPPPAARVAPPPPPPRMAAPPPPRIAAPPPPGWLRRRHPHRGWLHRRHASPRQRRRPPDGGTAARGRATAVRLQRRQPRSARRTFRMLIVCGQIAPGSGRTGPKSPGHKARKPALFPCFWLESGYIPRHLTRKHGSKGRPVAAGP